MEGATYALRNGFDSLKTAGMQFTAIRLTGGGSNSPAWRQMVADIFELPVAVPEQGEGAAFGAALQALWAHDHANGGTQDIAAIAREHVRVDNTLFAVPDPQTSAAYRGAYREFLRYLDAAKQLYGSPAGAT
jgi:xylulokinase